MGRFSCTVEFYPRAREPYPPAFFATVADTLQMKGSERLMDLGTGPGLLALGFAPYCAEVYGVDIEPAMLEAAQQAAIRSGVELHLIHGRAESLSTTIGRFDIVSIGRALHWMEPSATRLALDRITSIPGAFSYAAPRARTMVATLGSRPIPMRAGSGRRTAMPIGTRPILTRSSQEPAVDEATP